MNKTETISFEEFKRCLLPDPFTHSYAPKKLHFLTPKTKRRKSMERVIQVMRALDLETGPRRMEVMKEYDEKVRSIERSRCTGAIKRLIKKTMGKSVSIAELLGIIARLK